MAIVFDPTLGYSVRETWEEAQKNPGAALDRCEIQLRIVAYVLATVPPVPGTEEKKGDES
jgi:hypothetical protein